MRTVGISDGRTGYFHAITVENGRPVLIVEVMLGGESGGEKGRFVAFDLNEVFLPYRVGESLPDDNRPVDPLIVAAQVAQARATSALRFPGRS